MSSSPVQSAIPGPVVLPTPTPTAPLTPTPIIADSPSWLLLCCSTSIVAICMVFMLWLYSVASSATVSDSPVCLPVESATFGTNRNTNTNSNRNSQSSCTSSSQRGSDDVDIDIDLESNCDSCSASTVTSASWSTKSSLLPPPTACKKRVPYGSRMRHNVAQAIASADHRNYRSNPRYIKSYVTRRMTRHHPLASRLATIYENGTNLSASYTSTTSSNPTGVAMTIPSGMNVVKPDSPSHGSCNAASHPSTNGLAIASPKYHLPKYKLEDDENKTLVDSDNEKYDYDPHSTTSRAVVPTTAKLLQRFPFYVPKSRCRSNPSVATQVGLLNEKLSRIEKPTAPSQHSSRSVSAKFESLKRKYLHRWPRRTTPARTPSRVKRHFSLSHKPPARPGQRNASEKPGIPVD